MGRSNSFSLFPLITCLSFLVLGLLINLLQLAFLLTLPTDTFRRVNYYLMYSIYGYLLFLGDWWSGSRVVVHAEPELACRLEGADRGAENAIVLMNHHTELDWLYSWMGADRLGVLGNCKVFAKDSLKFAPIIGWAWAMSDTVFLKRSWEKDKELMRTKLSTMFSYPSPVWLLLFPEGTRLTPGKQEASLAYCEKEGVEPLHHHLLPRTKGFAFLASLVDRSRVEAVYDITLVAEEHAVPFTLSSILLGLPTQGSVAIRRLPIASVPEGMDASADWLMDQFREKDRLKDHFLAKGNFGPQYREVSHTRGLASLVIFLATNTLVVAAILLALVLGDLVVRAVILVVLGTAWLALHRLTSISTLASSSSQGLDGETSVDS